MRGDYVVFSGLINQVVLHTAREKVLKWYFVTFTGATTSRFSCGNSENEFLPIINEYFAFPELKPV